MVMMCLWAVFEGLMNVAVFLMRENDFRNVAIFEKSMKMVLRLGRRSEMEGKDNDGRAVRNVAWIFFLEKSPSFGGALKIQKRSGTFLGLITPLLTSITYQGMCSDATI